MASFKLACSGIDVQAVDCRAKWLEILKAVSPNLRSVAVLAVQTRLRPS
jgi:hypothetical protein